jgi:hypothetical protein
MIIFNCKACGNELKASKETKGKRGKCPICSSINVVPSDAKHELIFDEIEIQCKNPILQKVYDEVSSLGFRESIIASRITTDANGVDLVLFNVRTGDHNERKQAVALTISPPIEGVSEESSVRVYTEIGNIKDATASELLEALRKVTDFWSFDLQVDENYLASLNYSVPVESTNISHVAKTIFVIAWVADTLEGAMLGVDEH